jgi:hypothetical protein
VAKPLLKIIILYFLSPYLETIPLFKEYCSLNVGKFTRDSCKINAGLTTYVSLSLYVIVSLSFYASKRSNKKKFHDFGYTIAATFLSVLTTYHPKQTSRTLAKPKSPNAHLPSGVPLLALPSPSPLPFSALLLHL